MEKKETLDAIEERIKALEEEVKAQKVQNKRLRVVITTLVVLAVLPYLIAAGMQTQTFRVLRVERLEFVQGGELMAAIVGGKTIGGSGSGLLIYDKNGKPVMGISSLTGGLFTRGIYISDKGGKPAITIMANSGLGNSVDVYNNNGKIVSSLGSESKSNPLVDRDSGYLSVNDSSGGLKIGLVVTPEKHGQILVYGKDGQGGVSLGSDDEGGKIMISRSLRRGDTTTSAIGLFVAPNGSGQIMTTNSLGLPIWSSPLW